MSEAVRQDAHCGCEDSGGDGDDHRAWGVSVSELKSNQAHFAWRAGVHPQRGRGAAVLQAHRLPHHAQGVLGRRRQGHPQGVCPPLPLQDTPCSAPRCPILRPGLAALLPWRLDRQRGASLAWLQRSALQPCTSSAHARDDAQIRCLPGAPDQRVRGLGGGRGANGRRCRGMLRCVGGAREQHAAASMRARAGRR